eukprot:1348517-Amorphochlora_amoeboformis.AAC.1
MQKRGQASGRTTGRGRSSGRTPLGAFDPSRAPRGAEEGYQGGRGRGWMGVGTAHLGERARNRAAPAEFYCPLSNQELEGTNSSIRPLSLLCLLYNNDVSQIMAEPVRTSVGTVFDYDTIASYLEAGYTTDPVTSEVYPDKV